MTTNETRPLWQWSAREVVAATTCGEVSCAEVARSVADRVAAANPAVNAVTLDLGERAVEAARALDEAFARGAAPGTLHGVPVTVKDNVDVARAAHAERPAGPGRPRRAGRLAR